MDMPFFVNFLAEIGLDIGVVSLIFAFSYTGKKWKIPVLLLLVIVTPFYLHTVPLSSFWLLVVWCLAIPFGFLILIKNIQASALSAVLNPVHSVLYVNKGKKKQKLSKKTLSERIKDIEKTNIIFLTAVLVTAVASGTLNVPQIMQIPLFWTGLFVIFGISIVYYFSDKDELNDRLNVNLKAFLISSYVLMSLAFISFYFYLTILLNIEVVSSLTIACITVIIIIIVNNFVLSLVKQAILVSEEKGECLRIFMKLSNVNKLISFALVLALSDAPLVAIAVVTQNLNEIILWTIGFFIFFSIWLANTMRDDLVLQLEAGLIDKKKLKDRFSKMV